MYGVLDRGVRSRSLLAEAPLLPRQDKTLWSQDTGVLRWHEMRHAKREQPLILGAFEEDTRHLQALLRSARGVRYHEVAEPKKVDEREPARPYLPIVRAAVPSAAVVAHIFTSYRDSVLFQSRKNRGSLVLYYSTGDSSTTLNARSCGILGFNSLG